MLKTKLHDKLWFVTQPDHAQVAGYLAAHWGNDAFPRPGYHAEAPDPERLRAEVILAVAQHDNGWWEWEADPDLADDRFPSGLAEVLTNQQEGMNRWRVGLRRFLDRPYVNLLISFHAQWLYAARVQAAPEPAFIHPLFSNRDPGVLFAGEKDEGGAFLAELASMQETWVDQLRSDPTTSSWVEPEHYHAHGRLLQLLDGLSLSLCSDLIPSRSGASKGLGQDAFDLEHVPRRGTNDLVTVQVAPAGDRRITVDPYPFDLDPLPVSVPVRIFDASADRSAHYAIWWHKNPAETIEFRYASQ